MATETYTRERQLETEIAPAVEAAVPGVEVLAVELLSSSRFCVYLDHPDGVGLTLCEQVTRLLDTYRGDWTIDVSSPGPERPLRKPGHFRAALGRRVELRTATEIAGRNRFRGEVLAADDDAVTVDIDGQAHQIPVGAIVRGNLIDEGR